MRKTSALEDLAATSLNHGAEPTEEAVMVILTVGDVVGAADLTKAGLGERGVDLAGDGALEEPCVNDIFERSAFTTMMSLPDKAFLKALVFRELE